MNITPIAFGLDALRINADEALMPQLVGNEVQGEARIKAAVKKIEDAISDFPELRSEIVVAGVHVILEEVDSMQVVHDLVLPLMDVAVDRALSH